MSHIENVLFTEKPSRPLHPVLEDIGTNSASLTWQPPLRDGGSPISNYVIQARETTRSRWKQISSLPVPQTLYTVTNLNEGSEYEFRVIAENRAGLMSNSSKVSQPFTCHQIQGIYLQMCNIFCVIFMTLNHKQT